jgi:hypothetical protein
MIDGTAWPPLARLRRTRAAWLPIAGWIAFALVTALIFSGPGKVGGADRTLRGAVGFIVIPLVTYAIISASLGGAGLRASIRGVVALGAAPVRAALASVLVAMAASAVVCGLLAAIVCVIAHGQGDPPLSSDLPASFGVAFLGGAAYAAYFGVGSSIGKGAMRGGLLVVDWLVGAGSGFGALFTPRGHVASLLGGAPCFDLSRRASSIMLVLLAVAYLALTARMARRVR